VFEIFDEKQNNVIEFGEFVHALSVFHPKAPLAEKAECTLPPRCAARAHSAHARLRARSARVWGRALRAPPARAPQAWLTRALCACAAPPPHVHPQPAAAAVAFRIYDLGNTGAIDRSEVRTMLVAMLKEDATMRLPDAALERIIDSTFAVASKEVRLVQDDSIGPGEWLAFVHKMPSILNNMTLPVRARSPGRTRLHAAQAWQAILWGLTLALRIRLPPPAQVLRELTTAFPSFVLNSVASAGEMGALPGAGGDAPPLAPKAAPKAAATQPR
jgi:hypothetical protein